MSFNIPRTRKRRVVIIGGGFAGVKLARRLRRSDYQVVLVDRNNYHQFQPLIYQVASAGLEPSSISFPFRRIFRKQRDFHFRMAEAQAVDPQRNTLRTSIGSLEYDELVLAAGTTTNFYGNEHLRSHALPMKSVAEATALRNTLLTNFERALTSSSERERDELLNVVVAGGGATGVEIAGALAEMKRFVLPRDYPDLPAERMRIHLVEAGDRLLAGMSAPSSDAARRFLSRMGVEILLGKKVTDYRDRSVVFDDGSGLPSLTFIWVSGVEAERIGDEGLLPTGRGGRIRVDAFNRVEGYDNIYAIGDQCILRGDPDYPDGHPQLAQPAIQQGERLADNLCRKASGRPMVPFRYRNPGVMATVGRNRAVAEIGKLRIDGWAAWTMWLVVHLRSILGVKNRIIVFVNWVWNYFTYDQSLRLILRAGQDGTAPQTDGMPCAPTEK
mgnify:FL=1